MKRFINRNIVVTGAASGIGLAVCHRIAAEGGNIAMVDWDSKRLSLAVNELQKYNTNIKPYICDVQSENSVTTVTRDIKNDFQYIHALNHNAGILKIYNTHEMTLEEFQEIININLIGTFLINKSFIPLLLKNEVSYLVNMSSIAEFHPHPWMSAYSATKGAIKSFTRSLFIEYHKQGLRANCISPGSVTTRLADNFIIPQGADSDIIKYLVPFGEPHMVTPDKIAGVIAMLCSDDAYHINGTEIIADGGRI
ncbi:MULTISPECIES: SDR family NAD(P)-dependent oxidoreductase [Francisella]|uniref:SDR family oxidoreductase n=1 Tax=Francisella salimarina TaxID=2599927 RepID=A0AAJ4NPB4_9GAMM|nr:MULTISPECIES: SDR family oxidoreductase [Francisella]MBK2252914.1 SDR family oxidoreductase [Francisella philomiragia]QWU99306.1 SDR family oxidoreductase [Francisella salimarina]